MIVARRAFHLHSNIAHIRLMNSKYLYWGATILIALFAVFSGAMYFIAEAPAQTIERLGYPDYFRILLGIGKLIGAVVLLAPLPRSLKEWTYAAFTIDFIMAFVSHAMVGDPVSALIMPVVALALLMTSYAGYHQYVLAEEETMTA
jgi:ABC-type transport system involved in multi-copper enzyme maturation permease subunit